MSRYNGGADIFSTDSGYTAFGTYFADVGWFQKQHLISFFDLQGNLTHYKIVTKDSTMYHGTMYGRVHQTINGNYIQGCSISDQTNNDDINGADFSAFKWLPNGDTAWIKRIKYPYWSSALSAFQTSDLNYVFAGTRTIDPVTNKTKAVVVKLDTLGNLMWQKEYHSGDRSTLWSIAELPDKSLVFAGYYKFDSQDDANYHAIQILRTDSLGNQIWLKEFGGEYSEISSYVVASQDGNIIVASEYCKDQGFTVSPCNLSDYYLLKLNSANGDTIWTKRINKVYPENGRFEFISLRTMPDGNFLATGQAYKILSSDSFQVKGIGTLYKFNPNGDEIWYRQYYMDSDTIFNHFFPSARPALDGGIIGIGTIMGPGYNEAWIFKTDEYGCLVADCQVGIDELEDDDYNLFIYPNPAHDYISIDLPITHNSATLQIYNMQGQLVKIVAISSGGLQRIDTNELPNGIYQLMVSSKTKLLGRQKFVIAR